MCNIVFGAELNTVTLRLQLKTLGLKCTQVGGIHAVVNTLKGAMDCEPLLKAAVFTLRNFHRFDSKLTSIVVRLQVLAIVYFAVPCWCQCSTCA